MGQALEMCVHCENKRGCDTCTDLHNWIMEHLEPKQEWISVKDRLPPDGNKPYLTCRKTVKGRTVIESRYLHTSYESPCVAYWEGKKNGEVTHWMPLPEPPKEE